MIEVNLLPGGKKRSSRSFSFSLPSFGGGGGGGAGMPDRYLMFLVAAGVVSVLYMGYAFWTVRGEAEDLQVRLDEQVQDSIQNADLIARQNLLLAQRDSIAERVAIIQEIDADRYTWPHILDEVARSVPPYVWLESLLYAAGPPLQIRITGRAGNIDAMTTYLEALEASQFLRAVTLERNQLVPSATNPLDNVYNFEFVADFDPPPFDELETVPLFDNAVSAQVAVPDSAGGN